MPNKYFEYGELETEHLKRRCEKLALAIEKFGKLKREVRPEPFESLSMSIVSQQISRKAADSIWERIEKTVGKGKKISPRSVAAADFDEMRGCGLSAKKVEYIKGLADAVLSKKIIFKEFGGMSDEEIIIKLSALNGIGVWTAEMFLIFSMQRPDVVSWGDLAIRRGMMNIYGLKELNKAQFGEYRERYSPYGSVASLYLWALS